MPSQKMAQPSLTSEGTVGVSGAFAAAAALADPCTIPNSAGGAECRLSFVPHI
jgi:precorrin-4 methylase